MRAPHLIVVIAWLVMGIVSPAFAHSDTALVRRYDQLLGRFDPSRPGRGITDYPGNTVEDIPKGYAMLLMGELARAHHEGRSLSRIGTNAGRWLLDHSDLNRNGVVGWGVPVAWDAYGDGTVNPANTEYTISTAIVVKALLDWRAIDRHAPADQIAVRIHEALLPYLRREIRTPAGLFPYSLNPNDRPYDTFNPAAYLAGQMQRWSRSLSDLALREAAAVAADEVVGAFLRTRQTDPSGGWYWHYSIQEPVANDLAHAGYIIDGLHEYVRFGGRLSGQIDVERLYRHLESFVDGRTGVLRGWPTLRADVRDRGRLYDLGMALFLAESGRSMTSAAFRAALIDNLDAYRRADGQYMKRPAKEAVAAVVAYRKSVVREYECYLLYGLAHRLFGVPLRTR